MANPLFIVILCSVSEVIVGKYVYFSEKKTWNEAQTVCRTHFTDLAYVDNARDLELLKQAGSLAGVLSPGWIGLYRDPYNSLMWWWSGARQVTFHNWGRGQPDNYQGKENRGFVSGSGMWNDLPEDNLQSFYCINVPVVKMNLTWETALEHCRRYHKHLANPMRYIDYATGQMERAGVDLVWTGLRFLGDQWQWVSGAPLESQTRQKMDQCPAQNRCGALNSQGLLKSWDCDEELYFICEKGFQADEYTFSLNDLK